VGRLYFNLMGREAQGIVQPDDVPALTRYLRDAIKEVMDGEGVSCLLSTPDQLYTECNGCAPDLTVIVDNMGYRVFSSMGHKTLFPTENDTGPDGANHAQYGTFILSTAGAIENSAHTINETDAEPIADSRHQLLNNNYKDLSLLDIAPTVLHYFNLPAVAGMKGRVLF